MVRSPPRKRSRSPLPAGGVDAEHGVAFGDEPRRCRSSSTCASWYRSHHFGVEGDQEVDRVGPVVSGNASAGTDRGATVDGTPPTVSVMTASCGSDPVVQNWRLPRTGRIDPNGDLLRTSWFLSIDEGVGDYRASTGTLPVGHAGTVGGERVDAVSGHGVAGIEISANHIGAGDTFHQPGVGVLLCR